MLVTRTITKLPDASYKFGELCVCIVLIVCVGKAQARVVTVPFQMELSS